jgi:GMP synthase (glutamine-hydrolysing)
MPEDADHAPFLLLSIREGEPADDEYSAMMRFAGLDESGLHTIRLTQQPLGSIDLDDWSGIILGGGPYNVSDPPESKSATQRRVESELLRLISRIVECDFLSSDAVTA